MAIYTFHDSNTWIVIAFFISFLGIGEFLYFSLGTACPLTPIDGIDTVLVNGVLIASLNATEAFTFMQKGIKWVLKLSIHQKRGTYLFWVEDQPAIQQGCMPPGAV
jgi:hypothetical protein